MSGPKPVTVELTPLQVHELQVVALGDDARLAVRARIVLLAADGVSNAEIARREGVEEPTVRLWRGRYVQAGLAGLQDAARRGRPTAPIELSEEERAELQRYVRRGTISQQLALRARIVLLCADGLLNQEVAGIVGVGINTVGTWRKRFAADSLEGLGDQARPGLQRSPEVDRGLLV